jgi:Xaa-Pro aminopeptidase
VLHLGRIHKAESIHCQVYTALLQGCINLASTVFPAGQTMQQLDVIIRGPLYKLGLTYGHGSTHGTGVYLGVHEGTGKLMCSPL